MNGQYLIAVTGIGSGPVSSVRFRVRNVVTSFARLLIQIPNLLSLDLCFRSHNGQSWFRTRNDPGIGKSVFGDYVGWFTPNPIDSVLCQALLCPGECKPTF